MIAKNYYEQLYTMKLDKQGKLDKLETYKLTKMKQEEAESLNRTIKNSES